VADRALALPELVEAQRLLCCLSFGLEIDTWGLVDRLLLSGRKVYVPRVDPQDHRIHLHRYPCELETLSFGLRQPPAGTLELASESVDELLDAVVLVGLGFDRRGYRLGYGSGYFDRFLAERRLATIGLAYDRQLLEELPVEPHDVALDVIVTETETIRQ